MFQVEQGHQRMICPADTTTRPILNVGTFTTTILGGMLNIFLPTPLRSDLAGGTRRGPSPSMDWIDSLLTDDQVNSSQVRPGQLVPIR